MDSNSECFMGCQVTQGENPLFKCPYKRTSQERWLKNIPTREDGQKFDLIKSKLCHRHFEPDLILKETIPQVMDQLFGRPPKTSFTLKKFAVPTRFPPKPGQIFCANCHLPTDETTSQSQVTVNVLSASNEVETKSIKIPTALKLYYNLNFSQNLNGQDQNDLLLCQPCTNFLTVSMKAQHEFHRHRSRNSLLSQMVKVQPFCEVTESERSLIESRDTNIPEIKTEDVDYLNNDEPEIYQSQHGPPGEQNGEIDPLSLPSPKKYCNQFICPEDYPHVIIKEEPDVIIKVEPDVIINEEPDLPTSEEPVTNLRNIDNNDIRPLEPPEFTHKVERVKKREIELVKVFSHCPKCPHGSFNKSPDLLFDHFLRAHVTKHDPTCFLCPKRYNHRIRHDRLKALSFHLQAHAKVKPTKFVKFKDYALM